MAGSIAFTSQEPWIQNMSVRDNILMGSTFHQARWEGPIVHLFKTQACITGASSPAAMLVLLALASCHLDVHSSSCGHPGGDSSSFLAFPLIYLVQLCE